MIDKNWLEHYRRQNKLDRAGIREQQTIIHIAQRQIEHAERRIKQYETNIARREALLENKETSKESEQE